MADVFTHALDWTVADLNHQVGYADLVLTRLGIKYLVVETKRPSALAWHVARPSRPPSSKRPAMRWRRGRARWP